MKGFGTEVLAYDVYEDKKAEAELGFKYVSLDEIYEKSDIISLHCPLTKDNENMIDKEAMKKMKKGVVIINTSRGKLINSKDLIKALSTEKIGGVGLDVFDDEGDFFLNDMSNSYYRSTELSVLLSMPNVVITSHQAFFTKEALDKIGEVSMENIKAFFETGKCENFVE